MSGGRVVDVDKWLDTRIEVINMPTGQVMCSARFEPWVSGGFVGDLQVASYRERANGEPQIDIWRLLTR